MVIKSGNGSRDRQRFHYLHKFQPQCHSCAQEGCRLTCSNYREVSLLSVAGKWFGEVLNTRLRGCTKGRVM